jgi:hypothetical protein
MQPAAWPGRRVPASRDADLEVSLRMAVEAGGDPREWPSRESLSAARLSTPFGVEIRFPSDVAEMLPGDEAKPIEIASPARQVVLATLVTNY